MKHARTYFDAHKRLKTTVVVFLIVMAAVVMTASLAVAAVDYRLEYVAGTGGTITGTAVQTVTADTRGAEVTATPALNYHFVQWSDGLTTAARADTATVDATFTATFSNTYTRYYRPGANGSIVGSDTQVLVNGTRSSVVTASPDTSSTSLAATYHFVQWSDGLTTAARADTATADATVTATFSNTHVLDYAAGANGSVVGSATQVLVNGTRSSQDTATPAATYHFVQWSDGLSTAARADTATADATFTASFAINTYTITIAPSTNGTITPSAVQTIPSGSDSTTLTITPAAGYHFVSATDNGSPITPVDGTVAGTKQVKFTNVTGNHTLAATFARTSVWVPVYRFFQLKTGSHFYTASEEEMQKTMDTLSKTYRFEGVGFQLDTTAPTMVAPLYRFFNVKTGVHFFTASSEERDDIMAKYPTIYHYEGVAYKVSKDTADAPVYRFFNKKAKSHFYTSSETEMQNTRDNLSSTFTFEGIGYYLAR
jgi:hypothetical protein